MYIFKLSRFAFESLFWFSTLALVSLRILFVKSLEYPYVAFVATSDALKLTTAINLHYKKLTIFDVSSRPKPSTSYNSVIKFSYLDFFLKAIYLNFNFQFLLPHLSPYLLGTPFYVCLRLFRNIPIKYYEDGLNAVLYSAVSNLYLKPSRNSNQNYLLEYSWDYPGDIGLKNSMLPIDFHHFIDFPLPSSLDQARSLHVICSKYLSPARVESILTEEVSRQLKTSDSFKIIIYLHPNPNKNIIISSQFLKYVTIISPSSDVVKLFFSNLTSDSHIASGITSSLPIVLTSLYHCDLLDSIQSISFPVDSSLCSSLEQLNELSEFVEKFSFPLTVS